MGRTATLTNSMTKGVLDPALSERIDLAHYYNSLESGLNIECTPQGGVRRRAGTTLGNGVTPPQRMRRRVEPLPLTAGMMITYNGGTVANLADQSLSTVFTTAAVSGSVWVVWEADFGVANTVCFVDVTGFSAAVGRWERSLQMEWWDGSAWQPFGPAGSSALRAISTAQRTRRWAMPPGQSISARSFRLVLYSAVGAGAINVRRVRFWKEKRGVSTGKSITFARTADLVYEMVLTDRNIDVFRDHAYQASIPVDIDATQIPEMAIEQTLDTMFLYHEDVQTVRITRQGGNDEWNAEGTVFTNVPALDAGAAFSGDQDEIQDLRLPGLLSGQKFVLWLGDAVSGEVVYAQATFAADLRTALLGLGVPSGLTVASLGEINPGVRITFSGTAGGRRWPVVLAVVIANDVAAPQTSVVQRGVEISGPIMGETTGWPRCGLITQERHLLAGFRAAPMTYGLSRFGNPFDFLDIASPLTADLALFATLNTRQVQTIHQVTVGRDIHFFTEAAEWVAEATVIDATQPFAVRIATGYGIKSSVAPVFADGATLFVQRGGRVLRDMVYADVELSYTAEPLSLLAPHLLTDIVDLAHRPSRSTSEGNQLFMVNAAGDVVFVSFLRRQEVVASAPWDFGGHVRSISSDVLFRTWLLVERTNTLNGSDLYLEKLDGTHTLDGAVRYYQGGAASDVVSGLDHFEGQDVWAWADGNLLGPYLVTGGEIVLPQPYVEVIAGRAPPLRGRLPRLREKLQNGYPWRPPARIYEVSWRWRVLVRSTLP
jgi:hypothetical protein